jgi:cysteinyl-tRNA synthetase
MLINEEYTNILGIDEHTALVINGEKEIFSVDGIGSVTVKTSNGQTVFEAGNEYSLSELQSILQVTNKKELQPKKTSSDNIDVNSLKKEIAKLNLEIKNNNDFTTLFDKTILEIINLRNKFRIEKKYSESDEIRDLLDNLDITIEDNKTGSSWKFKGQ